MFSGGKLSQNTVHRSLKSVFGRNVQMGDVRFARWYSIFSQYCFSGFLLCANKRTLAKVSR